MRNGIAKGKQSLGFAEAPYLLSAGTIVGQKESQGPLGKLFDERGQDKNNLFGKTTWEEAESEMQKQAPKSPNIGIWRLSIPIAVAVPCRRRSPPKR